MTQVDDALKALSTEIAYPPTPVIVDSLALPARPRRARGRYTLVALAAAGCTAAAVLGLSSGARSAFLEFFGVGGVKIIRLDDPPPVPAALLAPFGRRVSLEEAQRAVRFSIRLPVTRDGQRPTEVFLDPSAGGIVSLVWCCKRQLVLTEVAAIEPGILEKTIGPATRVERLQIKGQPALWLEGPDHVLRVPSADGEWVARPVRVKGNVLVWTSGDVTLRLEGELSLAEALAIADRVR